MKTGWLVRSLLLPGLILINGCGNLPMAACAPADMGAPGNLAPANGVIVSLSPSLTWEYFLTSPSPVPPAPGPSGSGPSPTAPSPYPYPYPSSSGSSPYPYPAASTDCTINGYEVHLVRAYTDTELGGNVSGSSTQNFTPAPLMPVSQYFWEVRALSDAGHGPWSGYRTFFTGPMCETSSLAAPSLLWPTGVIHTLSPTFYWNYPGSDCLPQGYRIDLSTSSSFADTSLSGGTGNPTTTWAPAEELMDCTTYYWRVAAINDTTLGPFSPVMSFKTQVGTCPTTIYFIPKINANCRLGPNPLFAVVGVALPGEQFPANGKHYAEDGAWFDIQLPNNLDCWVFEKTGELLGDPDLVSVVIPPNLPEPKPGEEFPDLPGASEPPPPPKCTTNNCRP